MTFWNDAQANFGLSPYVVYAWNGLLMMLASFWTETEGTVGGKLPFFDVIIKWRLARSNVSRKTR